MMQSPRRGMPVEQLLYTSYDRKASTSTTRTSTLPPFISGTLPPDDRDPRAYEIEKYILAGLGTHRNITHERVFRLSNAVAATPSERSDRWDESFAVTNMPGHVMTESKAPENDRKWISCNNLWNQLQSNPDFQDGTFDLDGLCDELRVMARCSETGVVVAQDDVDAALRRLRTENKIFWCRHEGCLRAFSHSFPRTRHEAGHSEPPDSIWPDSDERSRDITPGHTSPNGTQPEVVTAEENYRISCICGYEDDDGWTVACDKCNQWQHQACYFPQYEDKALPYHLQHYCIHCKPRYIDRPGARVRQMARRMEQNSVQDTDTNIKTNLAIEEARKWTHGNSNMQRLSADDMQEFEAWKQGRHLRELQESRSASHFPGTDSESLLPDGMKVLETFRKNRAAIQNSSFGEGPRSALKQRQLPFRSSNADLCPMAVLSGHPTISRDETVPEETKTARNLRNALYCSTICFQARTADTIAPVLFQSRDTPIEGICQPPTVKAATRVKCDRLDAARFALSSFPK